MFDETRIAQLGGWPAVARHTLRLAQRAWPPVWHYVGFDESTPDSWANENGVPTIESIDAATHLEIESPGAVVFPPAPRRAAGGVVRLPPDPIADAYGHEDHRDVVAMARAVTSALSSIAIAIVDDRVPAALARGSMDEARTALAALVREVRGPAMESEIWPLRATWDCDAPAELTDAWNWIVNVGRDHQGSHPVIPEPDTGGEQKAGEGHSMQAFAELDDAKLYALLQADYSRALVQEAHHDDRAVPGIRRDELFERCVVDPITGYSGTGTLKVKQPDGSQWTTTIIPRDRRRVPLLPPEATASARVRSWRRRRLKTLMR